MSRDTYANYPVICLTCGNMSEMLLKQDADGIWTETNKCKCPKCSKTAYAFNPLRTQFLLAAIAKEIARIKGDIFELECMMEYGNED